MKKYFEAIPVIRFDAIFVNAINVSVQCKVTEADIIPLQQGTKRLLHHSALKKVLPGGGPKSSNTPVQEFSGAPAAAKGVKSNVKDNIVKKSEASPPVKAKPDLVQSDDDEDDHNDDEKHQKEGEQDHEGEPDPEEESVKPKKKRKKSRKKRKLKK